MKLDIEITGIVCPCCGKTDGNLVLMGSYAAKEINTLVPKVLTCNHCGKQYTITTSVIVSVDKQEDMQPEIPGIFGCNDCGRMTSPPNCEYCSSHRLTEQII